MRSMFETSLALQETGELMMPADAINTQLFKHQMYALAWMSNRENSETVPGGILADDILPYLYSESFSFQLKFQQKLDFSIPKPSKSQFEASVLNQNWLLCCT
mgnify:CR=1 FL=1